MRNDSEVYKVIGVMSGTSLDGLDIAYCEYKKIGEKWSYELGPAETIPYDHNWMVRLSKLHEQPAYIYVKTNIFYGRYIGRMVNEFINKHELKPVLISSHGHTIFHHPSDGYTAQIGHGGAINAETGIKVVSDFRTQDVVLGGQGAPLVPLGDELLFNDYDACLNLGGIANISLKKNNKRVAYDISVCNMLLNYLAKRRGLNFDKGGEIASEGKVDSKLLDILNSLPYYHQSYPKSLGREWVEKNIFPLMQSELVTENLMATSVEHIAMQISESIDKNEIQKVLLTGGGAYNSYLLKRMSSMTKAEINVPDTKTIEYKEALIFGFLGQLRVLNEVNIYSEVTGASKNIVSGAIWGF